MSKMSERHLTLQASTEIFQHSKGCPCCGQAAFACLVALPGVLVCQECGGYYGLTTVESANALVTGCWAEDTEQTRAEQRYFDLTWFVGAIGDRATYGRSHGWFVPTSGRVTQIG